jgi:divalent metal cation (Fe/Co/Zn/Cd) transporter
MTEQESPRLVQHNGRRLGPLGTAARLFIGLILVGSVIYGQLTSHLTPAAWTLGLFGFPALVLAGHGWWVHRHPAPIAAQLGSGALRADAACSITCAYMAGTLLVGLALNALLGWWWADSIAALALLCWLVPEAREALEGARSGRGACACDDDHCDDLWPALASQLCRFDSQEDK